MDFSNYSIENLTFEPFGLRRDLLSIVGVIFFIILGLVAEIGSILVPVIVFTNKSLRTACFQLIAAAAVGGSMVAASIVLNGVFTLAKLAKVVEPEQTGLQCHLVQGSLVGVMGASYHPIVTCAIAIDRLISLLNPIKYSIRSNDSKYVIKVLSLPSLYVVLTGVIGFTTAPLTKMVNCSDPQQAWNPYFLEFFGWMDLVYCVVHVSSYAAMLVCFHYKRRKSMTSIPEFAAFMKRQEAAMSAVRLNMILYIVTGIVPEIGANIIIRKGPSGLYWITMEMMVILKLCNCLVEFGSLMICSSKFRKGARQLFKRKSTSVVPLTGTGQRF